MKKSDRLKSKKKRKYRFDHETALQKYYSKQNEPLYQFAQRLME